MLERQATQVPRTIFLGGSGACSPGKCLKIEILKMLEKHWNCQSLNHHVLLYHFKSFTIPSGGPFWLLGGLCASPAYNPGYGPALRDIRHNRLWYFAVASIDSFHIILFLFLWSTCRPVLYLSSCCRCSPLHCKCQLCCNCFCCQLSCLFLFMAVCRFLSSPPMLQTSHRS